MSRWSDVSLTCLRQVVRVVLVEFGERHDKRNNGGTVIFKTNLFAVTTGKLNGEVASILHDN